jgi:hypothetical protein
MESRGMTEALSCRPDSLVVDDHNDALVSMR